MSIDVHQQVTDRVIAQMETAGRNWLAPFTRRGLPHNVVSNKPYQGINALFLCFADNAASGQFASYKQWQEKGGQVRKGEKGHLVVFYKPLQVKERDPSNGEVADKTIPLMRHYWVFSQEQVDGLPSLDVTAGPAFDPVEQAERFVSGTGATIHTEPGIPCYRSTTDCIIMPPRSAFHGTADGTAQEHYYATLLHELTHWTGHKSRLDRFTESRSRATYAKEELIAELGAAMLCALTGIDNEPREDHAKYLNGWLAAIKDDKRAIFKAAAAAQKAVTYLTELQDRSEQQAA